MISYLYQVIRCISQLELAQFIGSGVKSRYLTTIQSTANSTMAQQPPPGQRGSFSAVLNSAGD